jgi:hypothetical protein
VILQLDPPLPVVVDLDFFPERFRPARGDGLAHGWVDSYEHDLQWIVALGETGRCWCIPNPKIRLAPNITMGRVYERPRAERSEPCPSEPPRRPRRRQPRPR